MIGPSGQRVMGLVGGLGRILRAGKAGTLGRALGRGSDSRRKAVSGLLHSISWLVKRRGQGAGWTVVLGKGVCTFIHEETGSIEPSTSRQMLASENRTPPDITCRLLVCRCGWGLSLHFHPGAYQGDADGELCEWR